MHGGAQASLFDITTSLALIPISRPGFWMLGGVSRVLTVTYLRPLPTGEKVLLECEVSASHSMMDEVGGADELYRW